MDRRTLFPAGFGQALDGEPASAALAAALAADASTEAREASPVAVLRAESLCAAVFDAQESLILATTAWQATGLVPDFDQLRSAPAGQPVTARMAMDTPTLMLRASPARPPTGRCQPA